MGQPWGKARSRRTAALNFLTEEWPEWAFLNQPAHLWHFTPLLDPVLGSDLLEPKGYMEGGCARWVAASGARVEKSTVESKTETPVRQAD